MYKLANSSSTHQKHFLALKNTHLILISYDIAIVVIIYYNKNYCENIHWELRKHFFEISIIYS